MRVKNDSGSTQVWAGQTLTDQQEYDIPVQDAMVWRSSDKVITDITSSDLLIGDSLAYKTTVSESISFLMGDPKPDSFIQKVDLTSRTAIQNIPKVAIYKAEGSGSTKISHSWTDPCSWHYESLRVIAETPTLDTGLIYDLVNTNIIDLTHGRLYAEDDISGHEFDLYENAIKQAEDIDYTVDYNTGKITFTDTPSSPITVDYSHENGSVWLLKPEAGKVLHLEHAELNFSKNINLNSSHVQFQIWTGNPYFNALDPTVDWTPTSQFGVDNFLQFPYKTIAYKNMKDMIGAANLGQGFIPAIGELTQDIIIFPFNYVTLQSMKDSELTELRVSITDNQPLGGEWAAATFYILSEDE